MAEQALGGAVKAQDENIMNAGEMFGYFGGNGLLGLPRGGSNNGSNGIQGFTNTVLGKNTLSLNTPLGYRDPNDERYKAPPLIPNTQYQPPNVMPDTANAISSGLDPNAYDPSNLYGNLGKFFSYKKF